MSKEQVKEEQERYTHTYTPLSKRKREKKDHCWWKYSRRRRRGVKRVQQSNPKHLITGETTIYNKERNKRKKYSAGWKRRCKEEGLTYYSLLTNALWMEVGLLSLSLSLSLFLSILSILFVLGHLAQNARHKNSRYKMQSSRPHRKS